MRSGQEPCNRLPGTANALQSASHKHAAHPQQMVAWVGCSSRPLRPRNPTNPFPVEGTGGWPQGTRAYAASRLAASRLRFSSADSNSSSRLPESVCGGGGEGAGRLV